MPERIEWKTSSESMTVDDIYMKTLVANVLGGLLIQTVFTRDGSPYLMSTNLVFVPFSEMSVELKETT